MSSRTARRGLDNVSRPSRSVRGDGHGHNLRGLIYEKLNNPVEAVASYEQAVKIVPDESCSTTTWPGLLQERGLLAVQGDLPQDPGEVTDAETRDTIARYLRLIGDR